MWFKCRPKTALAARCRAVPVTRSLLMRMYLQGGSATGCDPGDAFETAQQPGHATLANFAITTAYCIIGGGEGETPCANVGTGTGCNSSVTLCANPDTGFLTGQQYWRLHFHWHNIPHWHLSNRGRRALSNERSGI